MSSFVRSGLLGGSRCDFAPTELVSFFAFRAIKIWLLTELFLTVC
jgi:hypothetical protein